MGQHVKCLKYGKLTLLNMTKICVGHTYTFPHKHPILRTFGKFPYFFVETNGWVKNMQTIKNCVEFQVAN